MQPKNNLRKRYMHATYLRYSHGFFFKSIIFLFLLWRNELDVKFDFENCQDKTLNCKLIIFFSTNNHVFIELFLESLSYSQRSSEPSVHSNNLGLLKKITIFGDTFRILQFNSISLFEFKSLMSWNNLRGTCWYPIIKRVPI